MPKKQPKKDTAIDLGLTPAQFKAFEIVKKRSLKKLDTTIKDVAKAWGGKNRTYTSRTLKALIDKGLVERYSTRFYKLV